MNRQSLKSDGMPLLTIEALRRIEREHVADGLMERAGRAAAAMALSLRMDNADPLLVVAGPGNNGGDAAVAARCLAESGAAVTFYAIDGGTRSPDAAKAFFALNGTSVSIVDEILPNTRCSLIIDGLFGIGLVRPLGGIYAATIEAMQRTADRCAAPILALDCPSGLNAATGERTGPAITADATLTFIAAKAGLYTGDGPDLTGRLQVDPLGVPEHKIDSLAEGWINGEEIIEAVLSPRRRNSHKGDFGTLGILGGAPGMTGAALLAGRAALKIGCGRVFVGLRDERIAVDPVQPELMLRNPSGLAKAPLEALVCGPGLGTDRVADALLIDVLESPLPLVLDADALTLIGSDGLAAAKLRTRHAATLVTPHPGEAARMLQSSTREIAHDRIGAAIALSREFNVFTALKGCGTVIATPAGRWWINSSGNPLLASAGTGDVLAGITGALLAQRNDPETALRAAVCLHGLAADRALEEGRVIGLTAGELADAVRHVAADHVGRRRH